jgi:ankyrin repeat protein
MAGVSKSKVREFIVAARDGKTAALRTLLDEGVPVDVRDEDGLTALLKAAQCGRVEAAQVLTAAGAAVDARDPSGYNALHLAALNDQPALIAPLAAAGIGRRHCRGAGQG